MRITKSRLKQIIQEEIQKLNEIKFTKLGYGRPELQGPRSLGSSDQGIDKEAPTSGEKIAIWYGGSWHDTLLTDEELEAVHSAYDPEHERYTDVVERVLSDLRDLDIEDVEL